MSPWRGRPRLGLTYAAYMSGQQLETVPPTRHRPEALRHTVAHAQPPEPELPMIISRTPFRLSLGGGGTDLPSYYRKYGGFFVSGAVNKYMYITLNPRFDKDSLRVSYTTTEIRSCADEVSHGAVRETLKQLGIQKGLEIVSVADAPASAGLGSSGSFCVGLLTALHSHLHQHVSRTDLAEEACDIAINRLNEPSGKQDEYVASFGGICSYEVDTDGNVTVTPLLLSTETLSELEAGILMFDTGITRKASRVLSKQQDAIETGEAVEKMHRIKEIGIQSREALASGDLTRFGGLLYEHWLVKRGLVDGVSADSIDRWCAKAIENGALGAKLVGAGGGGFLMAFCNNGRAQVRKAMTEEGLVEHRFSFDFEGSKVIYNV
jgi:D-glycero-alpha-D-manno-heptose-7-phosphate kinase